MYNKSSYLIHYGIKGQKHGLRRFQNEDGSYTEEGKERYGIGQKQNHGSALTDQERQARTKKILAAVGGLALASLAAYGIWKATGNMKKEFVRQMGNEVKRGIKGSANRYNSVAVQRRHAVAAAQYNRAKVNATRMDAARNWISNKGKIKVDIRDMGRIVERTDRRIGRIFR